MIADNLLSRLSGVRPAGPGKWLALCPSHEDRTPSLSIREADDGKVLVHCWSGCDPEAILAAAGLTWRDLYPDRWREAEARVIAHGHKRRQKSLVDIKLTDYARHVLVLANADIRAGKVLSLEDQATVRLALEIAGGRHAQ